MERSTADKKKKKDGTREQEKRQATKVLRPKGYRPFGGRIRKRRMPGTRKGKEPIGVVYGGPRRRRSILSTKRE